MKEYKILEAIYDVANRKINKNESIDIPDSAKMDIDILISKIESNKSIVSALITSLVKKITNAEQDVRLHRTDFEGGYSARSLDTKVTSPFFKRHFPKYANKESSFLTLATREKIAWTKQEGIGLKIRNKRLKKSFLQVLDYVESGAVKPAILLGYFFIKLIDLSKKDEQVFQSALGQDTKSLTLNINKVIEMLNLHFSNKLSSRLPVIAIYSIYQILLPNTDRYKGKQLIDLEVHTSSDKHSFGDVEIYQSDKKPFEIVEVKHNIPITKDLIFDIAKKTENSKINRYYILTTYDGIFEDKESADKINNFILSIKGSRELDIIANGIIPTLKYYLRFIDDYKLFVSAYTKNLIKDAKISTEIKTFHIESWIKILKLYNADLENITGK